MDTTLDGLLNRRVEIEQPKKGYRVAVDTVLLGAAVPAKAGDKVLDLGCGVGGAMLCLAYRVPGISITGIDIQTDLAELCRRNILRNKFDAQMDVIEGDVTCLPKELFGAFDHVLMNPPYHDEVRHDVSEDSSKRTANTEKSGDLNLWVDSAAKALRPEGTLTLIHRADRQADIIAPLQKDFGAIEVLHILSKLGANAKRVIVRAKKGEATTIKQCDSFILHMPDGSYSNEAESILRHGKEIVSIASQNVDHF